MAHRARSGVAIALACALVGGAACLWRDANEPGTDGPTTNLVVRADVSASAVVLVVVHVTAPDIATPLVFNLAVVDGVASATITLPAGSNRTITMNAFDAGGMETHRGSVTVNVPPGVNPTIALVLTPLVGGTPINVTLGSFVVTVAPGETTLPIWGAETFTATIVDAAGLPVSVPVTWATGNPGVASVTSAGVVTAVWVGQTTIAATFQGAVGSAPLTVSALTWPNEPAGFQLLTDFGFGVSVDSGWQQVNRDLGTEIGLDFTAPRSPPTVLEFSYPIGFTGGVGPGNSYFDMTFPYPAELYVGFWWKASNPWQGHASGVNKIMFVTVGGTQQSAILEMRGTGSGPFDTQVVCEFPTGVVTLGENRNAGNLTLGQWHRMEMYLNHGEGTLRWWVDGVLKGDHSGVPFPFEGFDGFKFQPTWGGIDDVKTEHDYFWVDHVHASRP